MCVCAVRCVCVRAYLCVCVCALYIQGCLCAKAHSPTSYRSSVCTLFAHPYLSEAKASVHPQTGAMSNPAERSLTRSLASAAACSNTVSDLKETRDGELEDAGMAPRLHFFNYSTWRIEEPKTEHGPFCCVNDPPPPSPSIIYSASVCVSVTINLSPQLLSPLLVR